MNKTLNEKIAEIKQCIDLGMSNMSIADEVGCTEQLVERVRLSNGSVNESTSKGPTLLTERNQ